MEMAWVANGLRVVGASGVLGGGYLINDTLNTIKEKADESLSFVTVAGTRARYLLDNLREKYPNPNSKSLGPDSEPEPVVPKISDGVTEVSVIEKAVKAAEIQQEALRVLSTVSSF